MRKKKYRRWDKPRVCDPGMCDHCQYIGEGDFICDVFINDPEGCLVVEDWKSTDNYLRCRRAKQEQQYATRPNNNDFGGK